MDLHRLNHIVCLADTGNFSRAALRSHISQSALSRSIQAAEKEFGLLLFDRNGQTVTCTDAGAFIIERARKLLFESRCLTRDAELYRERRIGELAFVVGPYAAAVFLPRLLVELRTCHPQVRVRTEINNAESLATRLKAEELDFYLGDVRNVQANADFSTTPFARLEAGFFVRPGHPLLARQSVTPAMLLPYGIASVRVPLDIRVMMGKVMGLENNTPMPLTVELDDLHALKNITRDTDTVLGCAIAATRTEVAAQQLVPLQITGLPPIFALVGIVALKGRTPSPMAQWACQFLQQQALVQRVGIEMPCEQT